jgi:hypothetical protein
MNHEHAHDHAHTHAEPRQRDEGAAASVLMSGALPRLAAALAALVLLWAAVAWALADLPT